MLKTRPPQKAAFKRKCDNYARENIKKLLNYLTSELERSPTPGIPYIINARLHWSERLFWGVSLAICFATIFLLLTAQYERYEAAPTIMSVEKDYFNWNISFPSIILCPFFKIDEELLADFIERTMQPTGLKQRQDLGSYIEAISSATLDSIHNLQIPTPDILPLINSTDYAMAAALVFRRFNITSVINKFNWPMNLEAIMTEMGMCHVINSNVAVYDNPSNWVEGSLSKAYEKNNVELSIYDKDFSVEILNYGDAFKVYIKNSNDVILSGSPAVPFDGEGSLTFGVQLSSTKASPDIKSIPINRRKCRYVDEPNTVRYPVYSYNRCLMQCRITITKILCGCVPHFYKAIEGEKVCNLEELTCLINYKKELTKLSFLNQTDKKFKNIQGLPKSSRDCGCLTDCEQDFFQNDLEIFEPQENIIRLKIFVATFPKVRIQREILFSFYDIVLRSGGVVNLCIGASVISLFERLMTFLRIPIYVILQAFKWIYKVVYNSSRNK